MKFLSKIIYSFDILKEFYLKLFFLIKFKFNKPKI